MNRPNVICAAAFVTVAFGMPAAAQQQQAVYQAVVTEDTVMRSGDLTRYYEVASLDEGQIVRVVQDLGEWTAIQYPQGVGAYITGEDGRLQNGAIVVRAATTLRAPSALTGPSGSWKPLLSEPLPEGTTLELIRAVEGRDGREFFLVEAPESALGYVRTGSIRRATAADLEAASGATETAEAPSREVTTPEVTPQPVRETATRTEPADTMPTETAPTQPATPVVVASPLPDRWASIRDLEQSFDELIGSENPSDGDIAELISAFEGALGGLGDSPGDAAARRGLERRAEILKLRLDVRRALESEADATAQALSEADAAAERALSEDTSAGYLMIARLENSRLYNGRDLPRLFRLVEPSNAGVTIAYIAPDERFSIERLGRLVGTVIGVAGTFAEQVEGSPRLVDIAGIDTIDGSLIQD
ncbi:MAG: hypothetical protein AAGB51_02455 [Planctomycetota bacterium]